MEPTGVLKVIASLMLALHCGAAGAPVSPGDVCGSKIPEDLKRSIEEQHKGYRLPRLSDNLQEDIDYNKQHGGDGCLGVAAADFNGDGQRDYALLVTSAKGDHSLVLAALRSGESWRIEVLRTWKSERNRLYVAVSSPGTYQRSKSFNYPLSEPGEVESFQSALSGIVTGRTEASGIYYFWTERGWVHVWAID